MSSLSGAYDEADLPADAGGEGELLRRARLGDRSAYGQIVLACQDRLYNAMLRMVGDAEEARELTQEAFTRGLMKIDGFRGDASVYTWLFRIAVNLAITRLRKIQRHRVFSLDGLTVGNGHARAPGHSADQAANLVDRLGRDPADTPAQAAECRERGRIVLEALGRLDPDNRAILVMRDIEGFDYQQMADVLDLPLGTLKSRLFRARLALREQLGAYLDKL